LLSALRPEATQLSEARGEALALERRDLRTQQRLHRGLVAVQRVERVLQLFSSQACTR
jgi:hypothetical protein